MTATVELCKLTVNSTQRWAQPFLDTSVSCDVSAYFKHLKFIVNVHTQESSPGDRGQSGSRSGVPTSPSAPMPGP